MSKTKNTKGLHMRKEIIGILFAFLLIFISVSFLSYRAEDPFLTMGFSGQPIHNLFGIVGAHFAGIIISLFGLGSFWLLPLLVVTAIHYLQAKETSFAWGRIYAGGLFLMLSTGALLAMGKDQYHLFSTIYPAGGILGGILQYGLVKVISFTGALVVLLLLFIVGLVLTIRFSPSIVLQKALAYAVYLVRALKDSLIKRKARHEKTVKREKGIRHQQEKEAATPIKVVSPKPISTTPTLLAKQDQFEFMSSDGYQLPPLDFLEDPAPSEMGQNDESYKLQSRLLEKKLEDFGIEGSVDAVYPGPVITTFEYVPAPGVKINKIAGLADDLAMVLRATSIRIIAPIPGKAAVGIEVPNTAREIVRFKEIVASPVYTNAKSALTICLGKDIVGNPVVAELDKMPHLLIAGATGTGKSVALNAMICSLLYKSTPNDVRMVMVDPKRIELTEYNNIPHLITPVVTDVKKATNALFWAVREMERRYELLAEHRARNITQFNKILEDAKKPIVGADGAAVEKLPYIVIIIDELADLMMTASRDVEVALTRLAQMARASGIHLILATQRPSVDVLTGIIKANFPTRLTFQVSSKTDSRTIIDTNGAESLLGNGDMLFLPPGANKLQRIHGAYLSENELLKITDFWKSQKTTDLSEDITAGVTADITADSRKEDDEMMDDRYDEAVALVTRTGQASISMVQRHLRVGYNRAARMIEQMEKEGVVGPSDGVKPREVLARGYDEME